MLQIFQNMTYVCATVTFKLQVDLLSDLANFIIKKPSIITNLFNIFRAVFPNEFLSNRQFKINHLWYSRECSLGNSKM